MPRGTGTTDYSTGKIYRLVATGTEDVYVGSTCATLERRLWHHNHTVVNPKQKKTTACKLYEGGRTVAIELIEDFPCTTKQELLVRERYWMEASPTAVNRNTPGGLGWKEARERRAEEHQAYMAAFRATDYECECGAKIKRCEKARHERSAKHITAMS